MTNKRAPYPTRRTKKLARANQMALRGHKGSRRQLRQNLQTGRPVEDK